MKTKNAFPLMGTPKNGSTRRQESSESVKQGQALALAASNMQTPPKRTIKWFYCVKPHGGALMFILCLYLPSLKLQADTVVLRSGKTYTNVKTILGSKSIIIKFSNGKRFLFPRRNMKSIRRVPVRWQKKIRTQVEPIEDSTKDTALLQELREQEKRVQSEKLKPYGHKELSTSFLSATQSLIPGWSSMYLDDQPASGVLFTVLELTSLYLYLPWHAKPQSATLDPASMASLFAINTAVASTQSSSLAILQYYNLSDKVIHPTSGSFISKSDYMRKRNEMAGLLGSLLLIDYFASVVAGFNPDVIIVIPKKKTPRKRIGHENFGTALLFSTQSLIPGWSALYLNRAYWSGAFMSLLEVTALYYFLPWQASPKSAMFASENLPGNYYTYVSAERQRALQSGNPEQTLLVRFWGLQSQVVHPIQGNTISREKFDRNKKNASIALGGILFLDYIVSVIVDYNPRTSEKATSGLKFDIDASGWLGKSSSASNHILKPVERRIETKMVLTY